MFDFKVNYFVDGLLIGNKYASFYSRLVEPPSATNPFVESGKENTRHK